MPDDVARAFALLCGLRLEDGRTWGQTATDWQRADALALLDHSRPQRLHFLTRPRGGSKTTDLAAVAVAWLLEQAPPMGRGFVVAADEDQAAELVEAVRGFASRDPRLRALLLVEAGRLVSRDNGASMTVLPSDGPGNFGKRPLLTVVDEFAQWGSTPGPRRNWTAIASALVKGKGVGRLAILTTAGDPAHWSYRVLERARATPDRWRVHEVEGPLPWMNADDLDEQRYLLAPWEFERLHLNRWAAADDRLVDLDQLRACITLDGPQTYDPWAGRYVVGVDLALKRDNAVVTTCHAVREGARVKVVLDRQRVWTPSKGRQVQLDEVEAYLLEISAEFGQPVVVFDPAKGEQMLQRLQRQGIYAVEYFFTEQSVGKLGALLFRLLADGDVALPPDEDLIDELAHVRLVEKASGVRLDHDRDRHDDRAVSLALAAQHLVAGMSVAPVGTTYVAFRPMLTGDLMSVDF